VTNLKLWRLTNNLKQSDAASLCGLGVSAYSLIEAGRLRPSRAQQSKLERVFGAKAADMLNRVATVPK
jgi:transcriptional regulator with XRE-family HTH domain